MGAVIGQRRVEGRFHRTEPHPILRPQGAGQARLDGGQIERQHLGIARFGRIHRQKQALLFGVGFDQSDLFLRPTGKAQIAQRLGVNRKNAAGRAVFGSHVGNGGPIRQRQPQHPIAEEFDEFADHAVLAQHLGDRQHQIGRGRAFRQLTAEAHADHLRQQHADRLAEHGGFRLDTAYPPPQATQAVDHGGVRVGADQRVGVGLAVRRHDYPRQKFQIDLMDDAGIRRHATEIGERLLAPLEKAIALAVAGKFQFGILFQRVRAAEEIDLHRVVDDQFDRLERVDGFGIAAQSHHRLAHRRQIDHRRYAGEILQ